MSRESSGATTIGMDSITKILLFSSSIKLDLNHSEPEYVDNQSE